MKTINAITSKEMRDADTLPMCSYSERDEMVEIINYKLPEGYFRKQGFPEAQLFHQNCASKQLQDDFQEFQSNFAMQTPEEFIHFLLEMGEDGITEHFEALNKEFNEQFEECSLISENGKILEVGYIRKDVHDEAATIAILANGIRVVNFSSPHPFTFDDGTILPAVSKIKTQSLMLTPEEITSDGIGRTTDIDISFSISEPIIDEVMKFALNEEWNDGKTIVIIPLPVMQAMKALDDNLGFDLKTSPFRCVRIVDRVNKVCSHEKFCI